MAVITHHRALLLGTAGVSLAHGYLSVLGFLGLLNYTVPTKYEALDEAAGDQIWAWVHLACAVLLVVSLVGDRRGWTARNGYPFTALACNIGFAMMFTWAFFNLLWGLTAQRPVSLAGPGLAFVVAAGEQLLANGWMRGSHDKGR